MRWRTMVDKLQITNSKFQTNSNNQDPKGPGHAQARYDLGERTYQFARNTSFYCKKLIKTDMNHIYSKQLIRSSSSIGANYIEANESLSRKDFRLRIKICRKEAKESAYWLRLIAEMNGDMIERDGLVLRDEASQLTRIFASILNNAP